MCIVIHPVYTSCLIRPAHLQRMPYTVTPRYNAVDEVHEMEPRCKRGAL